MPKMELLFKKVYSNIYSKSNETQDSGNVKNYSFIKLNYIKDCEIIQLRIKYNISYIIII